MERICVIDFETTGMSPEVGARPTEVAIVATENGRIVDSFQSLMNPGVPIPYVIQELTGITSAMVRTAPPIRQIMQQAADFVGDSPLIAHNASFDQKFWRWAMQGIGVRDSHAFACTVLLSRRLIPDAPNHKLESLVRHLQLPTEGTYHRALADSTMTAHLLLHLEDIVASRGGKPVTHAWLQALQKIPKARLHEFFAS